MAKTIEDIDNYLIKLDMPYEEIGKGMWVIHDQYDHIDNIVVAFTPPVVVFRVKVMELPKGSDQEGLLRELLELNASEMVAGAYGLEDNNIVITDTLQAENLDYNEFQASVDAITLALSNHYPRLAKYRGQAAA